MFGRMFTQPTPECGQQSRRAWLSREHGADRGVLPSSTACGPLTQQFLDVRPPLLSLHLSANSHSLNDTDSNNHFRDLLRKERHPQSCPREKF